MEFINHNVTDDKPPAKIKFILYRDKMIYYNQPMQNQVLGILCDNLMPGGHLVIGVKESIDSFNSDKKFLIINQAENIYKKAVS